MKNNEDRLTIKLDKNTSYSELRNFYIYRLLTYIAKKQPYRPEKIPDYYSDEFAFLHVPTTRMGKDILPDMCFLSYFYAEFSFKGKVYRRESFIDQKTAHLELAMLMVSDMIKNPDFFEN